VWLVGATPALALEPGQPRLAALVRSLGMDEHEPPRRHRRAS
jgi:hypothetical protein